jgi:CHASE2 domain-containing sensor protein
MKIYSHLLKIGLVSTFIVLLLRFSGILQLIELDCYDFFFRLKLKEKPEERIVLVAIEHEDVNKAQIYPFNDQIYADFFTKVKAQNPRVIGWNIIRDVPVPPGTEELAAILETTPNLIGVSKITNPEKFEPLPILKERNQYADISGVNDLDGVVRKVYLYPIQNPQEKPVESTIPYLGLKLAYAYLAEEGIEDENSTINSSWLQLGPAHFPHFQGFDGGYVRDPGYGYQVLLNWRKPIQSLKEVNFFDVIEGKIPPDLFTDKIVLIGASSAANDFHVVPFATRSGQTLRGIDIIAQATSQFISAALDGRPLIQVLPEPLEWLIIGICSFSVLFIWRNYQRYSDGDLIRILLVTLGLGWAIVLISLIAFNFAWWLPVIPSLLGLLLSSILLMIYLPINDLIRSRQQWRQVAEQRACQLAAQESYVSLSKITEAIAMGLNKSLNILAQRTYSIRQQNRENISLFDSSESIGKEENNQTKVLRKNLSQINSELSEFSKETRVIQELITQIIPHLSNQEQFDYVNIQNILHDSWQWVYVQKNEKEQFTINYSQINDPSSPLIPLSLSSGQIALRNLLENAYNSVMEKSKQTNNQDYQPRIEVRTKNQPDHIEIEIWHNGIFNNIEKIGSKSQVPIDAVQKKLNLPLKISYWIIKGIHQGDIYLESLVEEKTKLTIILPKNQPKNKLEII